MKLFIRKYLLILNIFFKAFYTIPRTNPLAPGEQEHAGIAEKPEAPVILVVSGFINIAKHPPGNDLPEPSGPDLLHLPGIQVKDLCLSQQVIIFFFQFRENQALHFRIKTGIQCFFINTAP
jgi:hypothetical protein